MTKRQLRKAAYKGIVKEGQGHQETFDLLRKERGTVTLDELATEVSKVPSRAKWHANRIAVVVLMISLALIIVMRGLGIFVIGLQLGVNRPLFLLSLVSGLLIPALGIVMLATKRTDQMKLLSFLFILSVFRSLKDFESFDIYTLIALVPYIPAIGLGFWLPEKMKTPYTKKVEYAIRDNEKVGVTKVIFEQKVFASGRDLIDSEL